MRPVDIITSQTKEEKRAGALLLELLPDAQRETFAAARKQFLSLMDGMTKPKGKSAAEVQRHQKRMADLGRAYTFEQLNMRIAKVIVQHMSADDVAGLLDALDDAEVLAALRKLGVVGREVGQRITGDVLSDSEFVKVLEGLTKR